MTTSHHGHNKIMGQRGRLTVAVDTGDFCYPSTVCYDNLLTHLEELSAVLLYKVVGSRRGHPPPPPPPTLLAGPEYES